MVEKIFTEAEVIAARDQAQATVRGFLEKTRTNHNINSINTLIDAITRQMCRGIRGEEGWAHTKDAVSFLVSWTQKYPDDPSLSPEELKKNAESRFGIGILAGVLGIEGQFRAQLGSEGKAREI